jgi:hypothetical protein
MITQSNLGQAQALSQALDNVIQALAIVANPNLMQTLVLSAPGSAGVSVSVSIAPATLTALLTARQTALQNALAGLGVS